MRYNEEENRIIISAYELVSGARRGICPALPRDEDEPEGLMLPNDGTLSLDFCHKNINYRLEGPNPYVFGGLMVINASMGKSRRKPSRQERAEWRGESYISALLYLLDTSGDKLEIEIVYRNKSNSAEHTERESVSLSKLQDFFEKCIGTLHLFARCEIERVKLRMPSMKAAKFPYSTKRESQREFISAAYRTIAKGGVLYAEAPTGTGKTVSALFPAIRALGEGRVEKIFYLTPKGTTANAARELLQHFAEGGAKLRAVILSAKQKVCQSAAHDCTYCERLADNRLAEATYALFDKKLTVVTYDDIVRTANDFIMCPYELELAYSEICDIIICDFNYLFDPRVYIKRHFEHGGKYAFLIDEAHNLPDRAREMYSAKLSKTDFELISESDYIGEMSKIKSSAAECYGKIYELLYPYISDEIRTDRDGNSSAAYHTRELPSRLFGIIGHECEIAEEALNDAMRAKDMESRARKKIIQDYLGRLESFLGAMSRFDTGYELFIFLHGVEMEIKIFCIDPSSALRERLARGHAAVFFSATMTPIDYYRTTLGGDRSSGILTLDSPFAAEQISVSIIDSISTRYSEREDTLGAVCRTIAATLSAKRGKYMIFSPSFAYSEALYKAFCEKYPKIKSLLQQPSMTPAERQGFLSEFENDTESYLVGFAVMGGIYSEGIDLVGNRLIGAVVIGIGMPSLSFEREAIAAYYDEKLESGKEYAYIYPGLNRVLQAAGRVIRTEDDHGIVVLIDDRFRDPLYKKSLPSLWQNIRYVNDPKILKEKLEKFWLEFNN